MADQWHDLADSEIRRRLIQRGMRTEDAIALVARRDRVDAAKTITKWLSR